MFLATLIAVLGLAHAGEPGENCEPLLLGAPPFAADGEPGSARRALLANVVQSGTPAFLKVTHNGEIPVILVNEETAPKVWWFIEESLGTQLQLQETHTNDHGLVRLTDRLIDVDTPRSRGFGEINDTGIAWKPLKTYLPRRHSASDPILEVAYAVTPAEKHVAEYYHRARRAAIFRVPFSFGGNEPDLDLPNMLDGTSEHCFVFCKASGLQGQISRIHGKLADYGIGDVDLFMSKPEVRQFLDRAKAKILAADVAGEDELGPTIAVGAADLKILKSVMPQGVKKRAARRVFGNWLVALDSSLQYLKLMKDLGVSADSGLRDMHNPRATAVLVYDSIETADEFSNGSYRRSGSAHSWDQGKQYPLGGPVPELAAPAVEKPPAERSRNLWQRIFGP